MLNVGDLDKILDEGCGDSGYNDPTEVADVDTKKAQTPAVPLKPASKDAERRPVFGASVPPPEGVGEEEIEVALAFDEAARQAGFANADEYTQHMEAQMPEPDPEECEKEANKMQMAPGIKKSPVYMPPGAYPGDQTTVDSSAAPEVLDVKYDDHSVSHRFIKQSDQRVHRPQEGQTINFKTSEDGSVMQDQIGSRSLPWALESAVQRMKVGDVVEVTGRGEYAFADDDVFEHGTQEKVWRLELLSITGKAADKFQLQSDERIELANELRLQGNAMFKQGRLHRAMDYYQRGSKFMDLLEAEDMGVPGMQPDKKVASRNARIWKCQQPLLLNWALILIKLERFAEAERKCTEVLMDIEKECVKGLYRRGVCNLHLGNPVQARNDFRRAAELDTSIVGDVEKHMVKVDAMLRASDKEDKGFASHVLDKFFEKTDERTDKPAPVAETTNCLPPIMQALQSQETAAAKAGDTDDDAWCRQREAIYNHFLTRPPEE